MRRLTAPGFWSQNNEVCCYRLHRGSRWHSQIPLANSRHGVLSAVDPLLSRPAVRAALHIHMSIANLIVCIHDCSDGHSSGTHIRQHP